MESCTIFYCYTGYVIFNFTGNKPLLAPKGWCVMLHSDYSTSMNTIIQYEKNYSNLSNAFVVYRFKHNRQKIPLYLLSTSTKSKPLLDNVIN